MELIFSRNHEQVVFFQDTSLDFQAIIALHNSHLGPTLGGIRYYPYPHLEAALADVLRLSEAMTYKSALAGLNLGGGKSVILAKKNHDFPAIMRKMGECIEKMNGQYYAAQDVGVNLEALSLVAEKTKFISGTPTAQGGSGDPSPFTAYGVYLGIKAAIAHVFKSEKMEHYSVLLEGLGSVGLPLLDYLIQEKMKIYIDELDESVLAKILTQYPEIRRYQPQENPKIDLYAPCAIGQNVTPEKIGQINPKIIVGAANNQLKNIDDAQYFFKKNIVLIPDFFINAGGVINCAEQTLAEPYASARVYKKIDGFYEKTLKMLQESEKQNLNPYQIALKWAEKRLRGGKN